MSLSIRRREPHAEATTWEWPDDLHPVLRQVYSRRDLAGLQDLDLALSGIAPVGSFDALESAVELLLRHRDGRIVVAGDYDSDGATSTSLMLLCLRSFGFADVQYFIPDRFRLGYGLSVGALEQIRTMSPDLIITVDNGISSVAGIAAARAAGIDVLITDHHVPPDQLPDANVIVNPNLPGTDFPGQHLAGVGVAFYLLAALGRQLGQHARVTDFLDLVALGTVADLVRLDRSNRILVRQGLARIRAGRCRAGIRALCEIGGVRLADVTAATLAYQLGPRLNAAGRLDEMSIGVECLLAESDAHARACAEQLDTLNRSRRELETTMRGQAMDIVDSLELANDAAASARHVIVLQHEDWHEGLVGLIASRVRERSGLPSFAFAPAADGLKGSGRSIPGFHLRDALAEVDARHPGLIERFGGHAMAAGLSMPVGNLARFEAALEDTAQRQLDEDDLRRVLHTDGELDSQYLSLDAALAVRDGGPWGQGFPEPLFDGVFELREWRWLKDVHLRMQLASPDGHIVEAIAFNSEFSAPAPDVRVRAAYRLSINDYFGDARLQLIVEHCELLA
jgi:single-stranded-DNA-specific exonuclease